MAAVFGKGVILNLLNNIEKLSLLLLDTVWGDSA